MEKKASAFITFKNSECAKRAMVYLKQQPPGFFNSGVEPSLKGELVNVEYPATESSKQALVSASSSILQSESLSKWNQNLDTDEIPVVTLSKKARKLAAAENRIVYIRQLEISGEELQNVLGAHGKIVQMFILPPRSLPQSPVPVSVGSDDKNSAYDYESSSSKETVKASLLSSFYQNVKTENVLISDGANGLTDDFNSKNNSAHISSAVEEKTAHNVDDKGTSIFTEPLSVEDITPKKTAFVVFEKPSSALQAIAQKTAGGTLPRHKR